MLFNFYNFLIITSLIIPNFILSQTQFNRYDTNDCTVELVGEIEINNDEEEVDTASIIGGGIIEDPGTGGGSGYSNFSYETAYDIGIGSLYIYFAPGVTDRYYKFQGNELQYISVYSSSNLDYQIKVVDNLQNEIQCFNANNMDMNTNVGTFLNFYTDPNEYYYIVISVALSLEEVTIPITIEQDNWSNAPSLVAYINSYLNSVVNYSTLYYVDDTNGEFSEYIQYAVNEWNKLNHIEIVEYQSGIQERVVFRMVDSLSNNAAAMYSINAGQDTISINRSIVNNYRIPERNKVMMHELGHALGLDEFPDNIESEANVMVQGRRYMYRLGPTDIAAYNHLWGQ